MSYGGSSRTRSNGARRRARGQEIAADDSTRILRRRSARDRLSPSARRFATAPLRGRVAVRRTSRAARRATRPRARARRCRQSRRAPARRPRTAPSTLNSVSRRLSDVGPDVAALRRDEPPAFQSSGDDAHRRYPTPTRPNRSAQLLRQVLDERACARSESSHATASRRASSISAWSRSRSPDAQRRQSRLPRAEEIAGAAQLEVALGNHEPVGRLDERVEPGPAAPR